MNTNIRDYMHIHANIFNDSVLKTVMSEEPSAFTVFLYLVCEAKKQSHHEDNPECHCDVSIAMIKSDTFLSEESIQKSLELLVEGELIEVVSEGKLGSRKYAICNFLKWNVPRGSSVERVRQHRYNKTKNMQNKEVFAGVLPSNVTECNKMKQNETYTNTNTKTNKKKKTRKEKKETLDKQPKTTYDTNHAKKQNTQSTQSTTQRIYQHWVEKLNKPNNTRLTQLRKKRIQDRLKDGFTEEELKQTINHYAKDKFHQGQNNRNKVYDDIELFLRNDTKVSNALEQIASKKQSQNTQNKKQNTQQNFENTWGRKINNEQE